MASYVIPLKCDTKYEIAMSAKDEERESGMSNSWHVNVKTKWATTGTTGEKRERENSLEKTAGIIAGSIALGVMVITGIGCHRKRKRNRKRRALLSKRSKSDIIPLLQREVPPERITFLEELGRGAFGKVHRGDLKELPTVEVFYKPKHQRVEITEAKVVAIKTLLG
ncbi:hypothetical protein ACROYT_G001173 [Oculina patagonica]